MAEKRLTGLQQANLKRGLFYMPPEQLRATAAEHTTFTEAILDTVDDTRDLRLAHTQFMRARSPESMKAFDQLGIDWFDNKIAPFLGGFVTRREGMIEEAYAISYAEGTVLDWHVDPYQGEGSALRVNYALEGEAIVETAAGKLYVEEGGALVVDLNKHVSHKVTAQSQRLVGTWDIPVQVAQQG